MLLEHIIWSAAFAILVGILVERKWGYALPVWIIGVCAGLPDIDYFIQMFMYPIIHNIPLLYPIFIVHGDFHNIVMVIILSLFSAWLLNKYMKTDYNDAFICVFIGCIFHIFCDYIVYKTIFCPISPRFVCEINGLGIFTESGSWHGIGEVSIFVVGSIFLLIAICTKFYYLESKWIEDKPILCEGDTKWINS